MLAAGGRASMRSELKPIEETADRKEGHQKEDHTNEGPKSSRPCSGTLAQVRVTAVTSPELTAAGEAQDISNSGLGIFLPIPFPAGSLVRLDIADSVLYGFVAHSEEWPMLSKPSFARNKVWSEPSTDADTQPERRYQTGIDIFEFAVGTSGLSQLLKTTLEETLPNLEMSSPQSPD